MSEDGTEYTVKNLKLQDIQNYYNDNMTSKGVKVVVVGDVKQEEMLPKLAFLNKLPNKKVEITKSEWRSLPPLTKQRSIWWIFQKQHKQNSV